jgi:hypothetical protein
MSLTPLRKAWPLIVRVISSFMRSLCAMHKCKRISIDRSYRHVFPPHSQHGEMKFRNRSYDLLRFTELRT